MNRLNPHIIAPITELMGTPPTPESLGTASPTPISDEMARLAARRREQLVSTTPQVEGVCLNGLARTYGLTHSGAEDISA